MTDDFARAWRDWHDRREAALSAPHGWLSLTDFHWLDEEPAAIEGLPGTWSAAGGAVTVTAAAADGLAVEGRPVDGTVTVPLDGTAWVDYGDKRIELAPRGGTALRVRDPHGPARTGFTGVPAFEPDPEWVVPARFTALPGAKRLTVGSVRAGFEEQSLEAVGTVAFELDGEAQELTAADAGDGRLWLLFRDPTNGEATAGFRQLTADAPVNGAVDLDFNRSLNMPCAFTDFGTCPLPPPENRLTVAVTAGERRPA